MQALTLKVMNKFDEKNVIRWKVVALKTNTDKTRNNFFGAQQLTRGLSDQSQQLNVIKNPSNNVSEGNEVIKNGKWLQR